MRLTAYAAVLAVITLTSVPLLAQGPATAVRITVLGESGAPAQDLRIIGAGGELLGTTDADGSATVSYHTRLDDGTQMNVVQIDRHDGRQVALIPEGAQGLDWTKAATMPSGGSRQGLDKISWGRTPWITVTQRAKFEPEATNARDGSAQVAPAMVQGPKWFAGPLVGRNLEREAFLVGLEAGMFLGPQAWGSLFGNLQLTRTGVTNGTLWGFAPGVGVVPSSLSLGSHMLVRFIGSVIYNRFSSEFSSGSDTGVMLTAGVLYGINASTVLGADLAAQRLAGFTSFLLTFNLLYGPNGFGTVGNP